MRDAELGPGTRGGAATRLRGISTRHPRRRRDAPPRNIHAAPAAAPRRASAEYRRAAAPRRERRSPSWLIFAALDCGRRPRSNATEASPNERYLERLSQVPVGIAASFFVIVAAVTAVIANQGDDDFSTSEILEELKQV